MTEKKKYIVLAGLVVIVIFAALFLAREKFVPREKEVAKVVEQKEPAVPAQPAPEKVIRKKIEKPVSEPVTVPEKPAPVVAVPEPVKKKIKKVKKSSYQQLIDDVRIFFDYLDQQDYIKAYKLEDGTQEHFLKLLAELSASPPVISGETQDIYTLTHNMAHFYRVIGKNNISLGKDVLGHEREIIEPAMEMLYEWVAEEIKRNNREMKTSIKELYEYASFFLNTLSGKAYLARRDSKTRILVIYYSLLMLDTANRLQLNSHGIDVLPPLNLLMDDIENQRNLDYREKYLKRLRHIKRRVIARREKGLLTY